MDNYIYGYARVSTQQQELQRQLDMLKSYNCTEIFTEKMSGTKMDRPELNRLKDKVRCGDTLVIESFSRLGRSTKDLIELVEYFENKGVKIVSIKENFDTVTPQGKLMLTVFQAFSQFERDLIAQRTKEGLASARVRGRNGGRPKVKSKNIEQALKLYHSKDYSISEIVKISGVSQTTLYRYLKNTTPEEKVTLAKKTAKIYLNVTVENNNKFVRGKKKSIERIEDDLKYYELKKLPNGQWDYLIYVEYETKEDLENTVYDILSEMSSTADYRNCFVEAEAHCKELDMWW